MHADQAAELRSLVRHVGAHKQTKSPYTVVVSGGKSGVGTSTLAATTAAVLGRAGRHVVLVDADPRRPTLDKFCPETRDAVPHSTGVLSEIAVGFDLLQAPWATAAGRKVAYRLSDLNRFADSLSELGSRAEYAIIDVGNGLSAEARALWSVSDAAMVTTAPDNDSIMASYAVIKAMHKLLTSSCIMAPVSQTSDKAIAADVYRRLSQSCQRFLGQELVDGGGVPKDALLANSLSATSAGVLGIPDSPGVYAVEHVVCQLKATLGQQAIRRSA